MKPQRERFVDEYLIDLNATKAAIRANLTLKSEGDGFYVYFLIDGRDGRIFYIGKGKGRRLGQHRKEAARKDCVNVVKASRIRDCGPDLIEAIFADKLDEVTAYKLEKSLIEKLKMHGLTNISSGQVHPLESELARVDRNFDAIRSYEDWVNTATLEQLASAESLKGSTHAFYIHFVEAFIRLRDDLERRLISIGGNSNAWR